MCDGWQSRDVAARTNQTEAPMMGIGIALKIGPRLAAAVGRTVGVGLHRIKGIVRALAHRSEIRQLSALDDRMLKDIGLSRSDVVGALSEPLLKDPSTVLLVRSVERRARQHAPAAVTRAPRPREKASMRTA
jgi:uncharacterized protein YjiS (DUF1127 family)